MHLCVCVYVFTYTRKHTHKRKCLQETLDSNSLFLLSCIQKKGLPKKHFMSSVWYTGPLTVLVFLQKNGSKIRIVPRLPSIGSVS